MVNLLLGLGESLGENMIRSVRLWVLLCLPLCLMVGACGQQGAPDVKAVVTTRPAPPPAPWAARLCTRVIGEGFQVLRARPITAADAAKLPGADLKGYGPPRPDYYLAVCKGKVLGPNAVQPLKQSAILVGENGSSAFVTDDF